MPQKKKLLFTTEQMIEFAKSCVKEFQLEANKTNPNNGDIVRATVDLPIPALTIPEAEVDAEQIIESDERLRHILFGHPDDYSVEGVIKAMHKYSDLRLAKAMEEKGAVLKLLEQAQYRLIQAIDIFDGSSGLLGDNGENKYSRMIEVCDEIELFLADKKKGEGK